MNLPQALTLSGKWFTRQNSLDPYLRDRRSNNLHLIRHAAAILVIVFHTYGPDDPVYRLTGCPSGHLAVPVFFFLSGMLVTQSLDQSPSKTNFFWKRVLRLYPAAWLVILGSALVIGPLVTDLPLHAYFSHPLFSQYLRNILLVRAYDLLPGVFTHSAFGTSVNASLWTLALELKLYLFLVLAAFIPKKARILIFIAAIILLWSIDTWFANPMEEALQTIYPGFRLAAYTGLAIYFLIGSLCYYLRSRILVGNYLYPLLLISWWISLHFHFLENALPLLVPVLTLCFAPARRLRLSPQIDVSYGIYLWGFPMQQLVANYLRPKNPTAFFLLVLTLSCAIALISWYTVENPALRLKTKRPLPKGAAS